MHNFVAVLTVMSVRFILDVFLIFEFHIRCTDYTAASIMSANQGLDNSGAKYLGLSDVYT